MSAVDLPVFKRIPFGNAGLQVSPMAFGTGTHGVGGHSDQSRLGVAELSELLVQAYDFGINFWDAADAYGTHFHLARALQTVQRYQVVILTKTMNRDGKRVAKDIDRFLVELCTDWIDVLLLHVVSWRDWTDRYAEAISTLTKAKEQGNVRSVGVSCHSLAALETAAKSSWTEVVMVRINYAGLEMDAPPEIVAPLLAEMHAAGKAVLGMKVLGAGRLGDNPGKALDYVFSLGCLHAITIGLGSRNELWENVRMVAELINGKTQG